ncbi:MAG: hypothetical protein IJ428_04570 [Clostridia bacterium]|nr:hypothetical protein [Clostridia bacterium]
MSILAELWNGTIRPVERNPWKSEDYTRISQEILQAESILAKTFSVEQKAQYERCVSLMLDRQSIVEKEVFEQGFKLGVQIVIAATREDQP